MMHTIDPPGAKQGDPMFSWHIDDRLELALWDEADAQELAATVRREADHLSRWLPWASPAYDGAAALDYIRRTRREWAEYRGLALKVIYGGQLAGSVGLHAVNREHGRGEIGYWLRQGLQGRGIITRAVGALVDYAFGALGLHRLVILVQPGNVKSRAIPERLGFRQEGLLRHDLRRPEGYVDHVVYGLLADEWTVHPRFAVNPPREGG
jgi:ribosomal-protein-serine acetyltransferase